VGPADPAALAVPVSASRRSALLRPTTVNAILAEVGAVQAGGRDVISLMRGEPDFPTPPHIVEAATRALEGGRTRYPDNRGEPLLREAVAQKLRRDNGVDYDPDSELLITTGATLGIHTALGALLDDGDEVLIPDPVYDAYASPVLLAGGRIRTVSSTIDGNRFVIRPEELEAAITPAARALLLNTPWNPVGTVLRRDELEALAHVIVEHNLVLISDEIYEAITYDGARHVTPASLSPALRARTIIVNSLSKTYAMTGWRVGYCAAPAMFTSAMLLVLQQASRGPATFVQDAAAAALQGDQGCVEEMRQEYARRRQQLVSALDGAGPAKVLPPEGGFFAMVDVRRSGFSSDEVRRQLLYEAGVAVVNGSAYGACAEGLLRVSFGSGGDVFARGLERLAAGLERLR
jgi:aspartate/methionine/tyrosine aminotransferase